MHKRKRIAFLASHNGTAARSITQACLSEQLDSVPCLLISNNPESPALLWAGDSGLETHVINATLCEDVDRTIAQTLQSAKIDLVLCSGYMRLIGPKTIASVQGRVINVHPALLPSYGGKGMYGFHVHKAVFENKEKETGITIHLVDEVFDHGTILAQKRIPIPSGATPESIENMVKEAEPSFYLETLHAILKGEISLL